MLNIAVNGANGRMGQEIIEIISQNLDKYNLSFAKVRDLANKTIHKLDDRYITSLPQKSHTDAVIDFSNPESALEILDWCLKHHVPLVIGATGFNSQQLDKINKAAQQIPILYSANMNLSVNVLFKVVQIVAQKLANFEVEISESHHRYKKDAPSGTALRLGEVIAQSRNQDFKQVARFDRTGAQNLARDPTEIGFSVIRGGDIVGRHTVNFISDGEELNFTTMVTNRKSFASGSLAAAAYIVGCRPGLYSMEDALGLNDI